jgi:hypothetical protein
MTGVGGMEGAHCHSGCRFAVSKVYPNSRSEGGYSTAVSIHICATRAPLTLVAVTAGGLSTFLRFSPQVLTSGPSGRGPGIALVHPVVRFVTFVPRRHPTWNAFRLSTVDVRVVGGNAPQVAGTVLGW